MKKIKQSLILFFSLASYSQQNDNFITNESLKNGIEIGSVIAIVISWSRNKSILYAILHAFFGWAYVIYFIIVRESEEK